MVEYSSKAKRANQEGKLQPKTYMCSSTKASSPGPLYRASSNSKGPVEEAWHSKDENALLYLKETKFDGKGISAGVIELYRRDHLHKHKV